MHEHDVQLPDGRNVSLAEYGDPSGRPVLHLHGAACCRFEAEPFEASAKDRGVRIFSLDRPGVGRSTEHPGRTIVGYGEDVGAVANALGLKQFAVSGFSNGGMYAFAAAYVLGDRVSMVAPINATTPIACPEAKAVLPLWARTGYTVMTRFPDRFVKQAARHGIVQPTGLAARINPDRDVMALEESAAVMAKINAEPKTLEYFSGEAALTQPWGFDHLAITQRVELFSGERDGGRRYAEVWASQLPNARLHLFPGGHVGHFARPVADTIVACLAG